MRLPLAMVLCCAIVLSILGGCGPLSFTVGTTPEDQKLESTVVFEETGWGGDRIAVVDVSGMIYNAHKPALLDQGENPVALFQERMRKAAEDNRVKAVILRINSPGGTVTATDAMYREVLRFKEQTGKPVVALLMDVAASGGYFLACSADQIIAYPTSVTGSIGVIMHTISFKPALDRWGIQAETFASGSNKAVGSPLTTMSEENREVLRSLVDDFYQRFRGVVRKARPSIAEDQFDLITDGRIVSGERALELGLVDQTGDIYDSHRMAKQLAGLSKADLVIFHRKLSYVGSPYAASPVGGGTQVNFAQINLPERFFGTSVEFSYLWQP